jgi:hypothetical protein
MSAVILPSARRRETLSEAGRGSSNNLCVATRLRYHRADGEGNSDDKIEKRLILSQTRARLALPMSRCCPGCGTGLKVGEGRRRSPRGE